MCGASFFGSVLQKARDTLDYLLKDQTTLGLLALLSLLIDLDYSSLTEPSNFQQGPKPSAILTRNFDTATGVGTPSEHV
tara:strand:- start:476 stop:712 length:237 start_codon:yes stop_codon:yes gene_type:complete